MIDLQQFVDKHRYHTRVDEDGTKIIPGKVGHIYEYDDDMLGVIIMPNPPRLHYWGYARAAFIKAGFTVVQDGDYEGAATFDPANKAQVKVAAKYAKIKQKRVLSEKQRTVLEYARNRSPLMRQRVGSGLGRVKS